MWSDESDEGAVSHAKEAVLRCVPANMEHADGDSVAAMTIGCRSTGDISVWAFDLADCRKIVVGLLAVLARNDDDFAQRLLDDQFPTDPENEPIWPRNP